MDVSEQELRALVRDAIARHTGRPALSEARSADSKGPFSAAHASHGRFLLLAPTHDGQCVIEPAVRCEHCGYCQSYGH
jgi:hypothetical protein